MRYSVPLILILGWFGCAEIGDTEPPVVTITNPRDGALVSGVIKVEAAAVDDDTILVVRFFVDGKAIGEDSTSIYECDWDTKGYEPRVWHSIVVRAWDGAGNEGKDQVRVMVEGMLLAFSPR